jgi:disulfide bond formation protein DsbB
MRGIICLAFVVALVALGGSLWLSLGMNLKACPLCLYQRSFVMGVAAILGMGLLTRVEPPQAVALIAMPLSLAALAVAVFHVYLEWADKLECPAGVLGVGTAPQQSLAILAIMLAVLVVGTAGRIPGTSNALAASIAFVLGVALAGAAIFSAPPMPGPPAKAYDKLPDICRPPFHGN